MGAARLEDLPHYTYEDYKLWDGEWELINGVAYAMAPAPVNKHQILNTKIARELDEKLDECPKCLAIIEADWKIADDLVLRPDASLICYEPDDYLTKAPEIIFEIISPSTAKNDETLKFDIYEQEGVKYYILVYPDTLFAKLYKLTDGKYIKVGDFDDESYTFDTKFCKIEFNFNNIFKRFRK
ncbi:MAG: Uma2 family endonuclease [Helicobacteraceae bacterium]|nr:Uma2 family endonuclease [Helicobacteraceae bacterium]